MGAGARPSPRLSLGCDIPLTRHLACERVKSTVDSKYRAARADARCRGKTNILVRIERAQG